MNRQKIKVESGSVSLAPHRTRTGSIGSLVNVIGASDGELLPPAVVRDRRTQTYVVIGGERRWLAMQRMPHLPTMVIVCDVWADYLAWLAYDKTREHPQHRSMPMPLTSIVCLGEDLIHYLRPGRDDHMDDVLGEYFEVPAGRIGETRSIKRIMDANNPEDVQAIVDREWDLVGKGEASPSAAFQRIRRYQTKRDAPEVDVNKQRTKLNAAGNICAGLVDGLTNFGDASPELSTAERTAHIKRLGDAKRALDVVIRSLRGGS